MNNHTPGPWIACDNNGYSIWRVTSPEYRAESASRTVAEVVGDSAETEANARLIAAAPEMYELLANLAAVCDSWDEDYENDEQRANAFWHMARIAKVLLLTKIEGGGDNG